MAQLSLKDSQTLASIRALNYAGLDSTRLRLAVGRRLARYLQADAFQFFALDPGSGLPLHLVEEGWPVATSADLLARLVARSAVFDLQRRAVARPRAQRIAALVRQASPAGSPKPVRPAGPHEESDEAQDAYVTEVLHGNGFTYCIQLVLATGCRPWGLLSLARRPPTGAFRPADLRLLERLAPHLATGLRAAAARTASMAQPGSGIGILVFDGKQFTLANAVARRLLRTSLTSSRRATPAAPANDLHHGLLATVVEIVARLPLLVLEAVEPGSEHCSSRIPPVTMADPNLGEVYRVRGERVLQAGGGWCSLVVIEPAAPGDLLEIPEQYGLTPREAEVARLMVRGHAAREIAHLLQVSPHTVKDHVQRVRQKMGVRSRRELMSRFSGGDDLPQ